MTNLGNEQNEHEINRTRKAFALAALWQWKGKEKRIMNTYRFNSPVINRDGKVVYGLYKNRAVYNPDFKWPLKFQRQDDVWVDEETDQIATAKKTNDHEKT